MGILEKKIERLSCEWAVKQGAMVVKIQAARGWPDRCILKPNGRVLFVEFKAYGRHPTPLQSHILQEMRKRGHRAYWINKVADFKDAYENEY